METTEKKYNPLIIFRLKEEISKEQKKELASVIIQGIKDGCIIIDQSVEVLAFNVSGDMVYPPPQ